MGRAPGFACEEDDAEFAVEPCAVEPCAVEPAIELCPLEECDPDPPEPWLPTELPEDVDPPDEPP